MKIKRLCSIVLALFLAALLIGDVGSFVEISKGLESTFDFLQHALFALDCFVVILVINRVDKLEKELATLKENKLDSPKTKK